MKTILLTGGAGFIGSHTAVALIGSGYDVVIADNLHNSEEGVLDRIEEITGTRPDFYNVDICDRDQTGRIFESHKIDGVVHFAGYKAVKESREKPLEYYRNNLDTTLTLLEVMRRHQVKNIVFSSSATVYGEENPCPFDESMNTGRCTSPYGWSKFMIEQILTDAAKATPGLSVVLLRYFNPIGAHPSGRLGEDPRDVPNNLMPLITQVAAGKKEKLTIFGSDYDTPDGTCRRDYLHVMDLAEGHVKAIAFAQKSMASGSAETDPADRTTGLEKTSDDENGQSGLEKTDSPERATCLPVQIFNLGTGIPYSVLEVVRAFEKNSGVTIPFVYGERREGDLPEFWADVTRAKDILGWEAARTLDDMCRDSWNWQSRNPDGLR